jgi:hypothetical protein
MKITVNINCLCGAVVAALAGLLPLSAAQAHCFVGIRFLPATINIDDPCVADELSLPTVSRSKTGDVPPATALDISGDISKRITENLGITIGTDWTRLDTPSSPRTSGFGNLATTVQYQFVKNASHELAMSAEISVDWGGTGAQALGTDSFSTITPSLQFGKGMGDLPDTMGWARPLALTGQVGFSVPTRSSTKTMDPDTGLVSATPNPQLLTYGATLQYSMPYLRSSVADLDLPTFVNHLIPIVEAQFATPVANNAGTGIRTTGTINPGVIWVGNYFQVGVEAIVPINRDSGTGVGFLAQLHLYLDDIFPRTIGQPLFGPRTSTATPLLEN